MMRWGVGEVLARLGLGMGGTVLVWGVDVLQVPMSTPGVRIEPAWDALGMRATCSHTVVLDNVEVELDAEVPRPAPASGNLPHERAWSLSVAAVYLGVAEAARDDAIRFAHERKPLALGGKSIASLPNILER